MITLGLLFPWMTRKFILWEMTFPEFMLYYVVGTKTHLKLSGLYAGHGSERKKKEVTEIHEGMDPNAIYEYYHNQHFDPGSWPEEIQMMYYE